MSEPQGYTQAVVDILNSKLGQSIIQAFTAGEEQERERIIKLLLETPGGRDVIELALHQEAVTALIKGEQK
ncbi:hypothetical protein UFOVP46_87 [uncultured Caudovirales phage]|uniref:Uncharacterized protein n=1 Tax=uncultured Caudovirales phage TaxID=2100421 RepID=A0A6J5KR61_9CAUD|nr:hypothetical protein UFOVP46_87 [uncultured Caudovirales phage]